MTGTGTRCIALATFVALAILGVSWSARAASALVVLIPAPSASQAADLVMNRTRGELLADGFRVMLADPTPEADRSAAVARVAHEAGASVTVGLSLDGDGTAVTLYLVDALGRVTLRRMEERDAVAGEAPEVVARHHVDRLRANLLDFLVANMAPAPPPPPQRAEPASQPPSADVVPASKEKLRFAIEAGLGVLGGFDGAGAAVMPVARVRLEVQPGLALRATAAGFGTQPRVDATAGSANVDQSLALIECVAQLGVANAIRPVLTVGAGVFHVDVTGTGQPPYSGAQNGEFAFTLDGGAGVVATIAPHIEVAVEGHALVTAPGIAVRFLDTEAARIGRPAILGTMSLTGWI